MCRKMAFKSVREAKAARTRITAMAGNGGVTAPTRLYLCDRCRKYHWTSMSVDEYKKAVEA